MGKWTFLHEPPTPRTFDIIWCRFPTFEDATVPGPKPRPALVGKVLRTAECVYVSVAYGTSKSSSAGRNDFYIGHRKTLYQLRLPQATAFKLERRVVIPWAAEWVSKRPDGSGPIIGRLTPELQRLLVRVIERARRERL